MAQPPRSGATQWHPLQRSTDTQQSMQQFGEGTAVTKVRPKPLLLSQFKPNFEDALNGISPSS
jgi:hypothetical protein